jgi:hypothetical protein
MIRPEQLGVQPDPAGNATVVSRRFRGADTLVAVQLAAGITVHSYQPSTLLLQPRERVRAVAQPSHVVAFVAPEGGCAGLEAQRITTARSGE